MPTTRSSWWSSARPSLLAGHLAVVAALVAWTSATDSRLTAGAIDVVALAAAGGAAVLAARAVPRARRHVLGAVLVGIGLALVGVTPRGAITVLEAVVIGAGLGLVGATGRRRPWQGLDARAAVVGALGSAVGGLAVGALGGRTGVLRAAALVVAAVAVGRMVAGRRARGAGSEGRPRATPAGWAASATVSVLAVLLVAWVAANDPTVLWFGHVTTHGDRHGDEVAITFDDGPDAQWSLDVARVLDEHGVKGTFFEVGKAIDARPDITQALDADGQLLGNHSYRHDYTGWLDPRYPELAQTQGAFERALGKCPALFRPPHGQRTPFMLAHVADRDMHTVTWDVSARDWAEADGHVVARRILAEVRPGSIILLHDGLDGKVTADRSVLAVALPEILEGLEARGLHAVRLDELLGLPAYLDHC